MSGRRVSPLELSPVLRSLDLHTRAHSYVGSTATRGSLFGPRSDTEILSQSIAMKRKDIGFPYGPNIVTAAKRKSNSKLSLTVDVSASSRSGVINERVTVD